MKRHGDTLWLAFILTVFVVAAYAPTLSLPFIGDDYVFLDKTRDMAFRGVWDFRNVDFGWYRPWSRELHFWALQRTVGLNERVYRAVGVLLWVAALCLYAAIVRRLACRRVSSIATLGVASLALWGTPLIWISGSQDLWMLCFGMAATLLFVTGRIGWSFLSFGLALLSKETAAVLPALLVAYMVLVERRRLAAALQRTAAFWLAVLTWLAVHPTLHARLLSGAKRTAELEHRPLLPVILVKTVLSNLNLDMLPHPQEVDGWTVLRVVLSAVILAGGVAFATRRRAAVPPATGHRERTGDLARFAVAWMAIGWFPLLLPSIAWHAYYGCLGSLGAWFGIAIWLRDRRRAAIVAVACLALLRAAQANTLSSDWGNESYQRRAGSILSAIRDELFRQHPTLPRNARVYFTNIPNNIGLIAGRSPALRVWYRDSMLESGFYSSYRPRAAFAPRGEDLFFRFDSAVGMVEVKPGAEDVRLGVIADRDWEGDHQDLAALFLNSGDVARAALEFEKLSLLSHRPDAAVYAGVCWEALGDTARADALLAMAERRTGFSHARMQAWIARLRRKRPGG